MIDTANDYTWYDCNTGEQMHFLMTVFVWYKEKYVMNDSYFDGNLLQLVGYRILGAMVTICTFGICLP